MGGEASVAARDACGPQVSLDPASASEVALREVREICARFRFDALQPQLDACAAMLRDASAVDVVLVGRFKAGKSSFLNCLFGHAVIPVGVLPVTSVVTRVRSGVRERARVHFVNGTVQEIGVAQLSGFVTEQQNPGNRLRVSRVEVELSTLETPGAVRFVDTPGLGSAHTHNTQTALDWLPRVGLAFLAVSVEHPLSAEDLAVLTELRRHTPVIAILLTKADLLSGADLAAVTRFVQAQLTTVLGDPVPIFPVSVRPGYEPTLKPVHAYLSRMTAAPAEASSQILRHKLGTLVAGCRQYISLGLAAAAAATQARHRLCEQLDEEAAVLRTVQREITLLATDGNGRFRDACRTAFLAQLPSLRDAVTTGLVATMGQWRGNVAQTVAAFEAWTAKALRTRLGILSPEVGGPLAQEHLEAMRSSVRRTVRGFQDRVAQQVEAALQTRFQGADFAPVLVPPTTPDVRVGRVFDTSLELVGFLIPMGLVGPLVRRHLVRRLPWEIEKNLHRVAGQWADAVARAVEALTAQAQAFLGHELGTIAELVREVDDRRPAFLEVLARLDRLAVPAPPEGPGE
jgi:GTP-binding protein EngB required for normal cell division